MWDTGLARAQCKALRLFLQAQTQGFFGRTPELPEGSSRVSNSSAPKAGSVASPASCTRSNDFSEASDLDTVSPRLGSSRPMKLCLHGMKAGVAMLSLFTWLHEIR